MNRVTATLVENRRLAPGVHVLVFEAPGDATLASPGQFAMIRPPGTEPLLARPMAYMTADGRRASFGMKVVGRGTAALAATVPGTPIVLWGPLGRPFAAPAGKRFILAGGGIGVPPLVLQASALVRAGAVVQAVLVGARTKDELFGRAELSALGVPVRIATDDGSDGTKGFVTKLLETERLDAGALVQACGPTPMLSAIGAVAAKAGAACELSLEARMGCGVGACRGCMVPVSPAAKAPEGRFPGREYLCLCIDGPAVDACDVDLERLRSLHG